MLIQSKYPGKCDSCGEYFERGDTIDWSRGRKARCHNCATDPVTTDDTAGKVAVPAHVVICSAYGELQSFTVSGTTAGRIWELLRADGYEPHQLPVKMTTAPRAEPVDRLPEVSVPPRAEPVDRPLPDEVSAPAPEVPAASLELSMADFMKAHTS